MAIISFGLLQQLPLKYKGTPPFKKKNRIDSTGCDDQFKAVLVLIASEIG
jgi:hypothetical protein